MPLEPKDWPTTGTIQIKRPNQILTRQEIHDGQTVLVCVDDPEKGVIRTPFSVFCDPYQDAVTSDWQFGAQFGSLHMTISLSATGVEQYPGTNRWNTRQWLEKA